MTQVDHVAETRPAALALAAALAAACLAAFSGFHQFDAIQTGAATALVTASLFLATMAGRAPAHTLAQKLGLGALALAAAWAVGMVALGPARLNWADSVAALSPLLLFGLTILVCLRLNFIFRATNWLPLSLALTAVVSAIVALLQRAGLTLPPEIPFVTPDSGWARAFADDPLTATGWFGLMIIAAIAATESASSRGRLALEVGMIAAAVGTVFTAPSMALILPLAAAAIFAVTGFVRKHAVTIRGGVATLVILLVALFAHPGPRGTEPSVDEPAPAQSADFVDHIEPEYALPFPQIANGTAMPSGDPRALQAVSEAAASLAADKPWTGFGPAALQLRVQEGMNPDSEWALAHPELTPSWSRAPVPAVRWTAEVGLLWLVLAGVGSLLLLLQSSKDIRSNVATASAAALAVPAFLLMPGGDTGAGALLAGLALGAGIAFFSSNSGSPARPVDRRFSAWIVPTLATVLCLFHFQNARWSLAQASGVQFAQHGAIEPAARRFDQATSIFARYQSEFNAGLVGAYNTSTERNPEETAHHLRAAAEMAPGSAIARFELASHFVRSMAGTVRNEAEGVRGRASAQQLLERALQINPNYASAGLLLSQALLLEERNSDAMAVLQQLLERPLPPQLRLRLLTQAADIYLDIVESPQLAIPLLEQALEIESRFLNRRDISGRLTMARNWVQSGERPPIGTGVLGEQPGDNHENPGGDHEHSADDVQDLYAPGTREPDEHGDEHSDEHGDEGSSP